MLKCVQASRVRGRASEAERAVLEGVPAMGGLMGTVMILYLLSNLGVMDYKPSMRAGLMLSFVKDWSDGLHTKTHTMHAYFDRLCCVKGRASEQ